MATQTVSIEPTELKTERLALRIWGDRHIKSFQEMNADAEVMRYFPSAQTAEQSNASIESWLVQFAERGWSNYAVELRTTGEFIGFVGLSMPKHPFSFSPCVEVGWRLKRSAWGHGFATEAAKECLRFGFADLGLAEIVSFTTLANTQSIKVMERIGLKNANADFDHPLLPEGHPLRRHCLYKLSSREWAEMGL